MTINILDEVGLCSKRYIIFKGCLINPNLLCIANDNFTYVLSLEVILEDLLYII